MIDYFFGNQIWSNVIMIAKGGIGTVEKRCQGATGAVKEILRQSNKTSPKFKGQLLSYTFATDEVRTPIN